jgi:hypothetical protein
MEIRVRRESCAVMLAVLFVFDCPAFAQELTMPSLGMTSPLGIGSASPVGPVGVPLGATAIQEPGVSPLTSGASPAVGTTVTSPACRAQGGAIPESSYGIGSSPPGMSSGISTAGTTASTTAFDGGGLVGSASGTCTPTDTGSLAGPAASASSNNGMGPPALGRVGIPMGSTQLGAGGLSPMPTISATSTLPLSTTPCPTTGMPSATGMPTYSGPC